jgi:hypothetical protein
MPQQHHIVSLALAFLNDELTIPCLVWGGMLLCIMRKGVENSQGGWWVNQLLLDWKLQKSKRAQQ